MSWSRKDGLFLPEDVVNAEKEKARLEYQRILKEIERRSAIQRYEERKRIKRERKRKQKLLKKE